MYVRSFYFKQWLLVNLEVWSIKTLSLYLIHSDLNRGESKEPKGVCKLSVDRLLPHVHNSVIGDWSGRWVSDGDEVMIGEYGYIFLLIPCVCHEILDLLFHYWTEEWVCSTKQSEKRIKIKRNNTSLSNKKVKYLYAFFYFMSIF